MKMDLKMINDDFTILVRHEFRKEVDKMLFDMGYSFKSDDGEHFIALEKENLFYFIDYKSKTIVKKKQISFLNDRGVFMSLHKLRKIWRKHRRQEGVYRAVKEGKFKGKQEYIDKGVIRSAMAEKGSTYRNVAESLNVSPSTVYRAMLGYRKIDLERKVVTEEACDFTDGYYKISVEKSNISKTQDLLFALGYSWPHSSCYHFDHEMKTIFMKPNKDLSWSDLPLTSDLFPAFKQITIKDLELMKKELKEIDFIKDPYEKDKKILDLSDKYNRLKLTYESSLEVLAEKDGKISEYIDLLDLLKKGYVEENKNLLLKLDEKQEKINQLHMEIEGLKSLIFPPENKESDKISLSFCGYKLKITK